MGRARVVFGLKRRTDYITNSHHHHHPHLHRKEHSREKEDPQSVHPNLQPHEGGTKSEGATPEESRSGRTSIREMPGSEKFGNGERGAREKRIVQDAEVKEERERGLLRAA
jgi:hypothetical protein